MMPRGKMLFRKTDVKRLLEAAALAGVKAKTVEVEKDGRMRLVVDDDEAGADDKAGIVL